MKRFLINFIGLFTICMNAQIVDIPDPNFKNALVNTPCVIFGPLGDCGDVNANVDLNNDGEIQVAEAIGVNFLCIGFQNITSLEGIEAFINLEELYAYNNDLTTIDVSNNLLLHTLDCSGNNLTTITTNTTLEKLNINNNEFTSLDISNINNLEFLECRHNQLSSIDISNNQNLTGLSIAYNELTSLDLSQNPNFDVLSIENNFLSSIDVSQNPQLNYLNISNNSLINLDLSQTPLLKRLFINNNNISSLDLSYNLILEELYIYDNNLSTIDVSQNPLLERLYIGGNNLSSFDVSNNTLLEYFSFTNSPLITGYINLSNHTVLWSLKCENTSISGLNIKNGDPELPNQLKAFNNPNLFCIDVDDPSSINLLWEVDEQVYFSEDCQLGIEEFQTKTLVLSPNPVKDSFTITTKLEVLSLKIFNLQGKLLYQENSPNHTLNITSLASGILFLQFTTDKGVITKKIIKQ